MVDSTKKMTKAKRVTQSIKENVVLTFEMLGGVQRYAAWADKNPDKFYDHWIKLLPSEVKAEISVSHDFTGVLERARQRVSQRNLDAIAEDTKNQVFGTVIEGEIVESE